MPSFITRVSMLFEISVGAFPPPRLRNSKNKKAGKIGLRALYIKIGN